MSAERSRTRSARLGMSAGLLLLTACVQTQAAPDTLEQRLGRLERLVDSGVLRDLLDRVEASEREIRELRDQVERLTHELERERLRQRDLYRDLDRRVQTLEGGPAAGAAGAGSAPPPERPAQPPSSQAAPPASEAPSPSAPPQPGDEMQAYRHARNLLLEERRPDAAIAAFQRFLQTHPESRYRPNALYWMAEAYYGKGDYARALEGFQRLLERFPNSDKAADARLKLGYTHFALGNRAQARKVLQEVVNRYPNSSVARLAEQKLRQLQ